MAALHKTAELAAAKAVRNVVVLHGLTATTRPGVAEGRERTDSHANAGGVLEDLVIQKMGGPVGDGVEAHAAGPDGSAVQKSAGPVGGPKVTSALGLKINGYG
jgi:hypothetical protein